MSGGPYREPARPPEPKRPPWFAHIVCALTFHQWRIIDEPTPWPEDGEISRLECARCRVVNTRWLRIGGGIVMVPVIAGRL